MGPQKSALEPPVEVICLRRLSEDAEALSILHIDHSSLAGMDFGCVAGACEMLLSSNLASFS